MTKISRINKSGGRFFCLRVLSIENREIGKQIKSLQRTLTEGDMGGFLRSRAIAEQKGNYRGVKKNQECSISDLNVLSDK